LADRWSEPSGALGTQRFRVWPEGTDKYDHAEMAANWDKLDAILGHPATGRWPEATGLGGGLYREIVLAKDAAVPLGVVFAWFRASDAVALPVGAVVCDGATYTTPDHDFPGLTDVTVPDLRNRFVLGADADKEIGDAGAAAEAAAARDWTGAPGPQGEGGENTVALAERNLPRHTHTGSVTGWSPAVMQWYAQWSTYEEMKNAGPILDNRDEAIERCGYPGCYWTPEKFQPIYPAAGNFEAVNWGKGVNHSTGQGGWKAGQHTHTISELSPQGGGVAHENRPRYIGLIWLVKVKTG
jgi:hypothetical protein